MGNGKENCMRIEKEYFMGIISEDTIIIGRNGNRIPLGQVKPGQMVIVEHAAFQTRSIPPQSLHIA